LWEKGTGSFTRLYGDSRLRVSLCSQSNDRFSVSCPRKRLNKNNTGIRAHPSQLKDTLGYLFLIIIYSLKVVPLGRVRPLQSIPEMRSRSYLVLFDKRGNHKLSKKSLVTSIAGECSQRCWEACGLTTENGLTFHYFLLDVWLLWGRDSQHL
jgi:hypothetical protein